MTSFPYTPCIPMQIKPIKACQGKGQGTLPVREWPCHPFSSTGLGSLCEFVSSQPQRCRHWPAVSVTLWLRQDKFTQTTKSCGGKGTARLLSQKESAPTLALTGFYCFSGHITLRMVLIYYAQVPFRCLQKTKERVLLII